MAIEWICEGCGRRICAFGISRRPSHGLCAVCAWMCEYIDPYSPEWKEVTAKLREE